MLCSSGRLGPSIRHNLRREPDPIAGGIDGVVVAIVDFSETAGIKGSQDRKCRRSRTLKRVSMIDHPHYSSRSPLADMKGVVP
jgi:hypothetical protein